MGTSNTPGTVLGGWRIIEMELWDGEAVDLMGSALIEFGQDQTGRFRFVAVDGWMDCRHEQREGRPHISLAQPGGSWRNVPEPPLDDAGLPMRLATPSALRPAGTDRRPRRQM